MRSCWLWEADTADCVRAPCTEFEEKEQLEENRW